MHVKWVAVMSAVAVVALPGCGDTDDQNVRSAVTVDAPANASDKPLGPRLSRAEFIAKANAICLRLKRSAEDIPTDTLGDLIVAGPVEQKAVVGGLADLRRVVPPEELDSDYERFLDALDVQHEDFQTGRRGRRARRRGAGPQARRGVREGAAGTRRDRRRTRPR